jgi:flavocytochrome c
MPLRLRSEAWKNPATEASAGSATRIMYKQSVDLIIVGAGLSGCVAALTAAEGGADVVVLEKSASPGGSSVMSADCYAFAGTDIQRRAGVADSEELLREDLLRVGGGESSPALVDAYVQEQLTTFEWLKSRGATFRAEVDTGAGQSVPRVHTTDTKQLVSSLIQHCEASGRVIFQYSTRAVRLRRDDEGGVQYVRIHPPQGLREISGRHGVVLATGGFTQDRLLVHRYAPQYDGALRVASAASTGDGLRMACELGADLWDMAYIKGTFGVRAHTTGTNLNCMAVYKGAIAVNQAGERFIDESKSYKTLGDACIRQPGQVAYQILDQDILASGEPAVRILDLMQHFNAGLFVTANSLTELARSIDVPPEALVQTVMTYNADIHTGRDTRFGRRHLVHEYGELRPIKRPPFHAYPSAVAIFGTYCGLAIDRSMRVLNVFLEAIEGLYAAGEVVGGFHGAAYMTGTALGKAAVFGRLAARNALERGRTQ